MRRRRSDFNFWPSVADTMLVAFIIVLGLWFGHQSLTKLEEVTGSGGIRITGEQSEEFDRLKKRLPDLERELVLLKKKNEQLRTEIRLKDEEIKKLKDELARATEKIGELNGQITKLETNLGTLMKDLAEARKVNDKPPIISLPESSDFKFASGTAELPSASAFTAYLERTVFSDMRKVLDRGDVNTIEIIGHTDGDSVRRREGSNLDGQLGNVLTGQNTVKGLKFGSNADLGLVRAVVVRREIEAWLLKENLAGKIQVRCYSAANSVPLTDELSDPKIFAGEDAARRRIEIRFTQLAPISSPGKPAGQ